jgi:hypothetical protein
MAAAGKGEEKISHLQNAAMTGTFNLSVDQQFRVDDSQHRPQTCDQSNSSFQAEDDIEDEILPTTEYQEYFHPGAKVDSDFRPGGIHGPQQVQYWEEVLKAPTWVMNVLQEGYALQFEDRPFQTYEEDNNASARHEMDFVREEVCKWEKLGIVSFVTDKPEVVSPLTVATRINSDGSVKRRLCWDGSRFLNPLLKENKVKLAHLQAALEITREGDFQYKYDLANAYFHIRIRPDHRKYLGAKFQTKDGKEQFFIFNFMPFGLSAAVYVITKLMKPLQAYFNQAGIRHTIYIDDGRIVANTLEKARADYSLVRQVLTAAGWRIAENKSDKLQEGSQVKDYLGFTVDSAKMAVFLTQDKKTKLLAAAQALATSAGRHLQVKHLAKYVGILVLAEPALGTFTSVMTRRMHAAIAETTEKHGWQAKVKISLEIAEDANNFAKLLEDYNGSPIRTPNTAMSVLSIIGPPSEFIKTQFIAKHTTEAEVKIWCGDASQDAVCAYSVMGKLDFFFKKRLTAEETQKSSGHRELLTVKYTLESLGRKLDHKPTHSTVYWLSDSENLVGFLSKGSRRPEIQSLVLEILANARKLQLTIIPIHLRREDPRIQIADAGSKSFDSDDWSIDGASFEALQGITGKFTVDLFADEANARVPRFFSNFFSPKCEGVDAFAQSWENEHCWACPPVKLIIRTVEKIRVTNCSGCLVVPEWQAAHFWPFLHTKEGHATPPFHTRKTFSPFIKQNSNARTALRGRPKFKMLAFFF